MPQTEYDLLLVRFGNAGGEYITMYRIRDVNRSVCTYSYCSSKSERIMTTGVDCRGAASAACAPARCRGIPRRVFEQRYYLMMTSARTPSAPTRELCNRRTPRPACADTRGSRRRSSRCACAR